MEIILFILLVITIVLDKKMMDEANEKMTHLLEDNLRFITELTEFHVILKKNFDLVIENVKDKEREIEEILNDAKSTKENYCETLNKIEKVLLKKQQQHLTKNMNTLGFEKL